MGLVYLPYPTKSTIHVGPVNIRPFVPWILLVENLGIQGEEGDVVLQNTLLNALGRSSQVAKVGWR